MDLIIGKMRGLIFVVGVVLVLASGYGIISYTITTSELYHIVVGANIEAMEMVKEGASLEDMKERFDFHTPTLKVEINGVDIMELDAMPDKEGEHEVVVFSIYNWDTFLGVVDLRNQICYSKQIQ